MEKLKHFSEATPQVIYGLLLEALKHDLAYPCMFRREQAIHSMPSDWANEENWYLALSRWSGALQKAKRNGLISYCGGKLWVVIDPEIVDKTERSEAE